MSESERIKAVVHLLPEVYADYVKDKARMDWLDSEAATKWWADVACPGEPGSLRAIIDEAMKGEQ